MPIMDISLNSSKLQKLFTANEIHQRVQELGMTISRDYAQNELHIIGVLKGAFIFLADLARSLTIPCFIHFLHASSYGSQLISSGEVRIEQSLNVSEKDVLVVDDILDTGLTLKKITQELQKQKPASLKICTLLDKPERRKVEVEAQYLGFTIPDEFVVGYGIDYAEHYRNLPYLAQLSS